MNTQPVKLAVNSEKCSVVLLDLAGTMISKVFVRENYYSYATKHAEEFLKVHWEDENVQEAIKLLKDEDLNMETALAVVKELTKDDTNNYGLKKLQSLICQKGFDNNELKASLFPDVHLALDSWSKSHKVVIYSTGNIIGQKLVLSCTTDGNLSQHIHKYFDESIGSKIDTESYKKIAKELEVKPEEIIFITDEIDEAKAAKATNVPSILIIREGNDPFPDDITKEFMVISSFNEINFEKVSKRKIEEEAAPVEEQPPSKIAKTESDVASEENTTTEVKVDEKTEEAKVDEKTEEAKVDEKTEEAKGDEKTEAKGDEKTEAKGDEKTKETNADEKTEEAMEVDNVTESETQEKEDEQSVNMEVTTEKDSGVGESEKDGQGQESGDDTISEVKDKEVTNSENITVDKIVGNEENVDTTKATKCNDDKKKDTESGEVVIKSAESKVENVEAAVKDEKTEVIQNIEAKESFVEDMNNIPTGNSHGEECQGTDEQTEGNIKSHSSEDSPSTDIEIVNVEKKDESCENKEDKPVSEFLENDNKVNPEETENNTEGTAKVKNITAEKTDNTSVEDFNNKEQANTEEETTKEEIKPDNKNSTQIHKDEIEIVCEDKKETNSATTEFKDTVSEEITKKHVDEKKELKDCINDISEKENKSDLANGIEGTSTNGDNVEIGNGEANENMPSVNDQKLKKVDESVEDNPSVAVEV